MGYCDSMFNETGDGDVVLGVGPVVGKGIAGDEEKFVFCWGEVKWTRKSWKGAGGWRKNWMHIFIILAPGKGHPAHLPTAT